MEAKTHYLRQPQNRPYSDEELEDLPIGELIRYWKEISRGKKLVTQEQITILIRKLSSDKFTRLKNTNRQKNKDLVQEIYTYRKARYADQPNSDKLKEIDRLMMLYLCKYSEMSMKKKNITPEEKDAIKKPMLAEVTKIQREFPSENSFQALAEIRCKHISIEEGWRLLSTETGQKYLSSGYLYIYLPYLDTLYHLDQGVLKDAKTGIARVREVFAKLKQQNPTGLNSHLYCKIFDLFIEEVKSKNDPAVINSLVDEVLKIYHEIPMKKELRTSQIHRTILELLFAANCNANTIIQFFNATIKELAEFKEKSHSSQYTFMLKFCYSNKHFVLARRLLSDAWNTKVLPHCPTFSNNVYEINFHDEGKMGGGTHYYNGVPKSILPLYIHAFLIYVNEEVKRQSIDHEICMRFICGIPDPDLKDDPDYKPNIKTVEEILNCYGLKARIENDNPGCLIVKLPSKDLLHNPNLNKYYYEGQLVDAAIAPASLESVTQEKQQLPPKSPFWDTKKGPDRNNDSHDETQGTSLDNRTPH